MVIFVFIVQVSLVSSVCVCTKALKNQLIKSLASAQVYLKAKWVKQHSVQKFKYVHMYSM